MIDEILRTKRSSRFTEDAKAAEAPLAWSFKQAREGDKKNTATAAANAVGRGMSANFFDA